MRQFHLQIPATPMYPDSDELVFNSDLSDLSEYAKHLLEHVFDGEDGCDLLDSFTIYQGVEVASVVRLQ